MKVWKEKNISLGLVYPMARGEAKLQPITRDILIQLYNEPSNMACMLYVVTDCLMGVPI